MGTSILWGCIADAEGHQADFALSEEVPEEVLQSQVVLEANSPLTGQAASIENYAKEQQQQLQVSASEVPPRLAPSLYRSIELLRLLKVLKGVLPFL
jgi:hypothetical protein